MEPQYVLRGKVRAGAKRGKQLGFPTANIRLHKKIPEGIYASFVTINRRKHKAATFIGSPKTFHEKDYKAEGYIFNFNENLYEKWITIELFKKIRPNKKFGSQEELIIQMKDDVKKILNYFNSKPDFS